MQKKRIILASLAAMTLAGALAVVMPMTSASAAECATNWNAATAYNGSVTVSHNSQTGRPSGGRRTRRPAPAAPASGPTRARAAVVAARRPPELQLPRLGGRQGLRDRHHRHLHERQALPGEHDNPGYDPIISTWFWEPFTCGSTNPRRTRPTRAGRLRGQRGAVQPDVPGPQPFYSYRGLSTRPRPSRRSPRAAATRSSARSRGVPGQREPRDRRPGLHRGAEHRELPALLRREPVLRLPGRPGGVLRPRSDPAELELQLQGGG